MDGTPAVGNQVSAQYARASKDMPHDGDADDQKVNAQASARASQAPKSNPTSGAPKGVGGNVDITA